jgi:hypothetical protein
VRTVSGSLLQTRLAKRLTLVAPGKDSAAPLSGRIQSDYSEIETNLQQKNSTEMKYFPHAKVLCQPPAAE